jgi:hypothetical protein
MVATEFVPNPNNYNEVNHEDGNKNNSAASNLKWMTHKMNMHHAFETNLAKKVIPNKGVSHHKAKLTEADVIDIRKMAGSGFKVKEITPKFNVGNSVISEIINNKIWKHVL